MPEVIRTVCSHDCPDACSVLVTVRDVTDMGGGSTFHDNRVALKSVGAR